MEIFIWKLMFHFAHCLGNTTDSLISAAKKNEQDRTSSLIFLTINIYSEVQSQAPHSVHGHHESALGLEGLRTN